MNDRCNYDYGAQSGASYPPACATDQHEHPHDHSSTPVNDNKPYSVSPGPGFKSSRGTQESSDEVASTTKLCASPDGSFKELTTVGQDQPGKNHPFMIKTSTFKTFNGDTIINRKELHWTIKPSKDGKARTVDYKVTLDRRIYDSYGRETASSHLAPVQGTFSNDGAPLLFEQPVRCRWSRDETRSSDEESKTRDRDLRARACSRA
jgi:hypothetical protein